MAKHPRIAVLALAAVAPLVAALYLSVPATASISQPVSHHRSHVTLNGSRRSVAHTESLGTAKVGLSLATPANPQCYGTQCDYAGTDGNDYCFVAEPGNITNWDDIPYSTAQCRNVDESFYNNTEGVIRLYYHPLNVDGGGAWACIPIGDYISDLSGDVFNNGPNEPGYHSTVWNDVGGSTYDYQGHCSKVIGP